jgi:hypothetical protein
MGSLPHCCSCCCGAGGKWRASGCQLTGMLPEWWKGGGVNGLQQEACDGRLDSCMSWRMQSGKPLQATSLGTLPIAAAAYANWKAGPWSANGWRAAWQ